MPQAKRLARRWLLCAIVLAAAPPVLAQTGVTYVHDELGRLVAVIDLTGAAAVYHYDAVGNLLSITRQAAGTVSILEFTPDAGPVGTRVTVYGTGFSATPASNALTFNGVAATVLESTTTRLVAEVPAGATTGPLAITTPGGSAVSAGPFTVEAGTAGPTIHGITPEIAVAGTPVEILGLDFDPIDANNQVRFNNVLATLSTATTTDIDLPVPAGATSGKVTVQTPRGTATSPNDFIVPPPPYVAADVESSGRITYFQSRNLILSTGDGIVLLLFDGTADEIVHLLIDQLTVPWCDSEAVLYAPNGAEMSPPTCIQGGLPGFADVRLTQTGTHTIMIRSVNGGTGQMTVMLTRDLQYTATVDGPPVSVQFTEPFQNARIFFPATSGQGLVMEASGVSVSSTYISLFDPNGTRIGDPAWVNPTDGGSLDASALPQTGTYSLLVDPDLAFTGAMTVELKTPPPDVTGTIVPGGPAVTTNITQPYQRARLTFTGTAGTRVSLLTSPYTVSVFTRITGFNPDGSWLMSERDLTNGHDFREPATVGVDGTYTVLIDPPVDNVGSATLQMYLVPPDVSSTLTIGGAPYAFSLTAPGQNAALTFAGTASQRVAIQMSGVTIPSSFVSVTGPGLTTLANMTVGTAGGTFTDLLLPTTGTYRVNVDPSRLNTGNMTVSVYEATDILATIVPGGPPVTVTIPTAGLNARITFDGTAGQRVSLQLSGVTIGTSSCCSATASMQNPDGSTLLSATSFGTSGAFYDTRTLTATGTHTILINPSGSNTGSVTLRLYDVPPDVSGTIVPGGAAVTATIGTPGQNAALTFTGAAGQRVSLSISGVTIANSTIAIRDAAGVALASRTQTTATGFIDGTPLPAAGTYSVTVDPSGSNTGAATLQLHDASDVTGTITPGGAAVTVTTTTPGQNARLTFSGATGQRISLRMTAVTISSSNVAILNPDGTTLVSTSVSTSGGFIDTRTLAATGTYTVRVDPSGTNVGSMTLTLYDVPADLSGTLVIAGAPLTASVTVPGQNGRFEFAGTTGQQVTLQASSVTIAGSTLAILRPDGTTLSSRSLTTSGGTIDNVTLPATGTFAVTLDPSGANTGNATLTLHDSTDVTATIVPGGPAVTVTTTVPGQVARVRFDGTAAQRVSLRLSGVTMGTSSCCGARVSILNPDGSVQLAPTFFGTSGSFIDPRTLPATGEYTIVLDPESTSTGSATLTLYDVPPDVSGSIVPGGAAVTATTTTPGQNALLSFTGTAGQRVSLRLTSVTIASSTVAILNPDGSTLVSTTVTTTGGFIDTRTLATAGTYTVRIDPASFNTGSMTATLYDVPADVTGPIVPGGAPVTVSIATPGQGGLFTWSGTAGQRVSLRMTGVTIANSTVAILNPDGTSLASLSVGTTGGYIDVRVLATTGTYSVRVDPSSFNTGSMTLTLYDVPPDPTGTLAVNDPALPITTTAPGQNASVTFAGTSGLQVTVRITGNTIGLTTVRLLRPDGTSMTSSSSSSASFNLSTQTLAVTGTYTIVIDPNTVNVGSLSVRVTNP